MAEHDQVPGHADVPLRVMVIIGRVIDEAIAKHNAEHHPPKVHDEPPLALLRDWADLIRKFADESAADAQQAHEQQFHSGMPQKAEDAPAPMRSAPDTLADLGNMRWYVHDTAREYVLAREAEHELNFHGRGVQAFDMHALLELLQEIRDTPPLRKALLEIVRPE